MKKKINSPGRAGWLELDSAMDRGGRREVRVKPAAAEKGFGPVRNPEAMILPVLRPPAAGPPSREPPRRKHREGEGRESLSARRGGGVAWRGVAKLGVAVSWRGGWCVIAPRNICQAVF